jgi:hypothetical protein
MRHSASLAAALALGLAAASPHARAADEGPRWVPSLKRAFALAKERGWAICVWCDNDSDASCKADTDTLRNKDVQKALKGFLCVYANNEDGHGSKPGTIDGQPARVCNMAPGIVCKNHKDALDDVYRTYGDVAVDKGGALRMPNHFVLDADGKVLGTVNNGTLAGGFDKVDPGTMVKGLTALLLKAGGPGISDEQYAAFQKALASARTSVEQNRMSEAAKALKPLLDTGKSMALVTDARELLKRVDKEATALYAKAQADLKTDAVAGLSGLDRVAEDYPGTESAGLAKKSADAFRASPEGKKALKDMAREKEGRERLARAAEVADGKKEDARALRMLDEIAKAYAGLPVAADAQARADAIRNDPERSRALAAAETERAARSDLVMAKGLLDAGKKDEAKKALRALAEKYPGTKAAEEARKLLEGLN